MEVGAALLARFDVVRRGGAGGMGTVFHAVERASGRPLALKLLRACGDRAALDREAEVLRALRHPGLVRYIDHGVSADGQAFIAMEWVEGPSLAERLASRPPSRSEALMLIGRAADALAAAHRAGVVHRDIKPANMILADDRVERVKLIDFGIAQRIRTMGTAPASRMAGTALYMAPEQTRGAADIDARADVYALGCVLFECLTGQLPWQGATLVGDDLSLDDVGQVAQAAIDRARRLSELLPGIPAELDALCARMLSPDRDVRPPHASAVSAALEVLAERTAGSLLPASTITTHELALVSLVLARPPTDAHSDQRVEAAARAAGAQLERTHDGSLVAIYAGEGVASDQVGRAAGGALALRAALPADVIAVCTGRANVARGSLGGALGARAREICERVLSARDSARGAVRVCDTSARLLGGRFDVCGDAAGLFLAGEPAGEAPRALLGQPAPFVGREAELAALAQALDHCRRERRARACVIIAEAGMGKSRLGDELARRAGNQAEVWLAQGDALRQCMPFGLIADLARRLAALRQDEALAVRRSRLLARLSRWLSPARAVRAAVFLGEVAGTPFDDADHRELAAARQDTVLMGDQIQRALVDLLQAAAEQQPLVVLADDLHAADRSSVQALDRALATAAAPLLLVAMARPGLHLSFPDLWLDHEPLELRLSELGRSEAERLARHALGADAAPGAAARVAALSGGQPLFIEELAREVSSAPAPSLPESVLLLAQARVAALEAPARRLLRAASVFGATFRHADVVALLGAARAAEAADWLEELTEREILARRGPAGFPLDVDYSFRHAVVREAAYASLTEADRRRGHALAAQRLVARGETDASLLAEHRARGGELDAAIGLYERAAEQAVIGNDFDAAIARVEQGVACGAAGADLGALRLRQAQAQEWRGDNRAMHAAALEALALLPPGQARWCAAAAHASRAAQRLGDTRALEAVGAALAAQLGSGPIATPLALAIAGFVDNAFLAGLDATALLGALDRLADEDDPLLAGHLHQVRAWAAFRQGTIGCAPDFYEPAAAAFELAGDRRRACLARTNAGSEYAEVGAYADARRVLLEALQAAESMGLRHVAAHAQHNLGLVLARVGELQAGRFLEEQAVSSALWQGNVRFECQSRIYLSLIAWLGGDHEAAAEQASRAAACEGLAPGLRAYALAALAQAELSLDRADVARPHAEEAMALLAALGQLESGESLVRLAHAEALHASGEHAAARAAIAQARARLLERADRLRHQRWREGFLEAIAENARTLARACAWA